MQKRCLFLIMISLSIEISGQTNLVPNPSFEIHDSCPDNLFQINRSTGWNAANGSPDYHHACASLWIVSVPKNFRGYQSTNSVFDSAYAGIYISTFQNHREILYSELTSWLTIGREYYISMILSPAYSHGSPCHCNNIGVKFVTYPVQNGSGSLDTFFIDNFSHVRTDSIISDTTNWYLLQGSFVADSAYTGILVGNFYKTDSTLCFCRETTASLSYYYVDRICVTEDPFYCPNYSLATIDDDFPANYSITYTDYIIQVLTRGKIHFGQIALFNLLGQKLLEVDISTGVTFIDLTKYSSSIYILRIGNDSFKFKN